MYKQFHMYGEVEDSYRGDGMGFDRERSWRKHYDADGEEVTSVAMYVLSTLREIAGGSLRIYDGTAASFRDPAHAHNVRIL